MKLKWLLILPLLSLLVILGGWHWLFTVPANVQLQSDRGDTNTGAACIQTPRAKALDNNGEFGVLTWNIQKQQNGLWRSRLNDFATGRQLVLLQEASLDPGMYLYLSAAQWFWRFANAFSVLDTPAGVMNLSSSAPLSSCGYRTLEPWLRLPKTALVAEYPLSDGSLLTVVNVHGINFSVGIEEYRQQLKSLTEALAEERVMGPIILAGDFNTWSEERSMLLADFASSLGLNEAHFGEDNRVRVLGYPLDHLFYRGLKPKELYVPETDVSDHNPMVASFVIAER
ncbi:endonuclease/exonuclease/phosphatase family protein [Shewanella sp.]|uniref:endonuclease/exonuclease/phosphatase family protein n=1 Tax=Shewanella sp. TaxID=50422 RepID=UPI000EC619A5|nr:endonuclease/exonuclease/phosphatase family protein [Shewanella sp.]HCD15784.1 endonuclease/exonuclease/phosphatase family protein [Shewanella sp.]